MKPDPKPTQRYKISQWAPHEAVLHKFVSDNPDLGATTIARLVRNDKALSARLGISNEKRFIALKNYLYIRLAPGGKWSNKPKHERKEPERKEPERKEHVTLPAVHFCPKCGTDMIAVATAMVMAGVTE